jgi:multidrug efflux pump subunit AcrA (membrane-fusion protein)
MKTVAVLAMAMIATVLLSSCGGSSSPATTTDNPAPAKVTGLSTPKSVSVVTAN